MCVTKETLKVLRLNRFVELRKRLNSHFLVYIHSVEKNKCQNNPATTGTSTIEPRNLDNSSSNSGDSSIYKSNSKPKKSTKTKQQTTPNNGPNGEERSKKLKKKVDGKISHGKESKNNRKNSQNGQNQSTSSNEDQSNKVPTLLAENIGLVVDLNSEPSCSQVSGA